MFSAALSQAAAPPHHFGAGTSHGKQPITGNAANSGYQFTTIAAPDSFDTEAYGINNAGIVSGFYTINGIAYGFWWRNGVLSTVVHSPDVDTLLGDVNEPEMVIGNAGSFTAQHAVIYSIRTGSWTVLPEVLGLPVNIGNGINPQGMATGSASQGNLSDIFNSTGWVWDGKQYSFFSVPGAAGLGTESVGINARGSLSGYFQDASGGIHGFLKEGSHFTTIDVPGAIQTYAYGLNSAGDVVGYYVDQQNGTHGFVWRAGNFSTVDVPGAAGTLVTSISDSGDLAGIYFTSNANYGFVASRH
jgi:hypothetical protein